MLSTMLSTIYTLIHVSLIEINKKKIIFEGILMSCEE